MGFTNVAWELRSAGELARDLSDGLGPMSVSQVGAAWVRVADEWASISEEYDNPSKKIKNAFTAVGSPHRPTPCKVSKFISGGGPVSGPLCRRRVTPTRRKPACNHQNA